MPIKIPESLPARATLESENIFTITEQTGSGYDVSWEGHSGGSTVTGTIISDKVAAGQTHTLVCNNLAVGSLTIEKLVEGTTTTKEFILDVTLSEPDGSPLSGTFSGYTFDENGYLELPITADQKITISGIPAGTVVNVAEQDAPGYNVTYQVNGSGVEVASATITHGGTTAVTVVNTTEYELPSTGGAGSLPLAFGGLLILAAALMYVIYFGRKRQKGGV